MIETINFLSSSKNMELLHIHYMEQNDLLKNLI